MLKSAGRLRLFIPREGYWRDMNVSEYASYNVAFQIRNLKLKRFVHRKASEIGRSLKSENAMKYMIVTHDKYRVATYNDITTNIRTNRDGAIIGNKSNDQMIEIIEIYEDDDVAMNEYENRNPDSMSRPDLEKYIKWLFSERYNATIYLSGVFTRKLKNNEKHSYPYYFKIINSIIYQDVEIEMIGDRPPRYLSKFRKQTFNVALKTIKTTKTQIEVTDNFVDIVEPMFQSLIDENLSLPIHIPEFMNCFLKTKKLF